MMIQARYHFRDIKKEAGIILSENGGRGVARSAIEMIFKSQNIHEKTLKHYINKK